MITRDGRIRELYKKEEGELEHQRPFPSYHHHPLFFSPPPPPLPSPILFDIHDCHPSLPSTSSSHFLVVFDITATFHSEFKYSVRWVQLPLVLIPIVLRRFLYPYMAPWLFFGIVQGLGAAM
ncbi:hypothetical protein M422DRAFT_255408 [Sphaerobolus stellatus SS14]|uniref:Uncharacterized protein n=1 Tax=Sphaerobolus stellatus (strain SS14) TaxID=990650 RepID=A0A0C9VTN7_SPHS4|nr:hypothetical protein M422DRAFT_255408 [Sphaerobolus stellatus SS14]